MATATIRNLLIALAVIIGFCAGWLRHSKPENAIARFAKHVKKTISAATLQTWVTNYLSTAADGPTTNLNLPNAMLRISIEQQPDIWTLRSGSGVQYLDFAYGGGFAHWGLAVGPTNFVLTPSDDRYVLDWVPGIYFWHER